MQENNLEKHYNKFLLPKCLNLNKIRKRGLKNLLDAKTYLLIEDIGSNNMNVKRSVYPIRNWHLRHICSYLAWKKYCKLIPFEEEGNNGYFMRLIYYMDKDLASKIATKKKFFKIETNSKELRIDTKDVLDSKLEDIGIEKRLELVDKTKFVAKFSEALNEIEIRERERLYDYKKQFEVDFKSIRNKMFASKSKFDTIKKLKTNVEDLEYKIKILEVTKNLKNEITEKLIKDVKKEKIAIKKLEENYKKNKTKKNHKLHVNLVKELIDDFASKFKMSNEFLDRLKYGDSNYTEIFREFVSRMDKIPEEDKDNFKNYCNYEYLVLKRKKVEDMSWRSTNSPLAKRKLTLFLIEKCSTISKLKTIILAIKNTKDTDFFLSFTNMLPRTILKNISKNEIEKTIINSITNDMAKETLKIHFKNNKKPTCLFDCGILISNYVMKTIKYNLCDFFKTLDFEFDKNLDNLFKRVFIDIGLEFMEEYLVDFFAYFIDSDQIPGEYSDYYDECIKTAPYTMIKYCIKKEQINKYSSLSLVKKHVFNRMSKYIKNFNKKKKNYILHKPAFEKIGLNYKFFYHLRKHGSGSRPTGFEEEDYVKAVIYSCYLNISNSNNLDKIISKTIYNIIINFNFWGTFFYFEDFDIKKSDTYISNYLQQTLETIAGRLKPLVQNIKTHYGMTFKNNLNGDIANSGNMILAKIFGFDIDNAGVDSFVSGILASSGVVKGKIATFFTQKKSIILDSQISV